MSGKILKTGCLASELGKTENQAAIAAAVPDATETVKGKVKLAAVAEAAGTSTTLAVTPAGLTAAIAAASTPDASEAVKGKVELATVDETTAGTSSALAVTPAGVKAAVAVAVSAIPPETKTTLTVEGVNYVYTNEAGVKTVVQAAQFLSPGAGNALSTDANGLIRVTIPAQMPDDQVLTGDNSGTVALTMTPVVDGDQTNYTVKADLKLAEQTPAAETNLLAYSAAGFYVSGADVLAAIPAASETVAGKVSLATVAEAVGTSNTLAVTPAGLAAAIAAAVPDVPDATDTVKGKVELATNAENIAGQSTTLAVTPAGVEATFTRWLGTRLPAEVLLTEAPTTPGTFTGTGITITADGYFSAGTPRSDQFVSIYGGMYMTFVLPGRTDPVLGVDVTYDIDGSQNDGGNDGGFESGFTQSCTAVNITGNFYRVSILVNATLAYGQIVPGVKVRFSVTPHGFSFADATNRFGYAQLTGSASFVRKAN